MHINMYRIFDFSFEKMICEAFQHKIAYGRRLENRNQRNVRNSDLVRIETYYTNYARMQPFTVVYRNCYKIRRPLLESAFGK